MSSPVYVEHSNPHRPPTVRRYDSLDTAITEVARALRMAKATVWTHLWDLADVLRYGDDTWEIVTAYTYRERRDFNHRMAMALLRGDEPPEV